jgi:amino acid transporter
MNEQTSTQLHRTLGFWAITAYGVGDILGAGIYALVGEVAGRAGDATWLAFLVTVVIAGLTALSYAELSGRFPRSGGEAKFCLQATGWKSFALLIGLLVFASGLVSLATVSRACAGYALGPWPRMAESPVWQSAVLVAFLLLLAAINFRGIRLSSNVNIACTLIEAGGLVTVIVAGAWFLAGDAPRAAPAEAAVGWSWLGVLQGSALAFFAFIGFEDMVNVAEEVKRPKRNLPAAILTAVSVAAITYIIVAWIATAVIPPEQLAASSAPLLAVVQKSAPSIPAWSFTLVALFAVANTGLLNFIMGSRLLYGMASQGLLPRWLQAVHPTTRTPHRSILVILLLAGGLALSGTLAGLAGTTNVLLLVVFTSVHISLLVLKLRERRRGKGFRVPKVIPVAGAIACVALIGFAPPRSILLALAIIAVAAVGVVIWMRRFHGNVAIPEEK